MITINAAIVSDFQACERRLVLGREWATARHRPKVLFDRCLQWAILELSNGGDPNAIASGAVQQFIEACTQPGLDIIGDPYTAAKDWCAMLETIIRCIGKLVLLKLHPISPLALDSNTRWEPGAWADDSGELHRWITVSSWDQDTLARELHSWYAFGDMAVLGLPMTLHAIHIGQMRNNRRASTWARGWSHPVLHRLRFRQTDGKPFGEAWKPAYLADMPHDWEKWSAQMHAEGVATMLIQHPRINVPTESACDDTRRQLRTLASSIRFLLESEQQFHQLPMSRSACDGLIPCKWQHACYSDNPSDTSRFNGIYRSREGNYTPRGEHV